MTLTTKRESIDSASFARCLFEASEDASFVFDPLDLSLVDANVHALELTGLGHQQLTQLGLLELFDAAHDQPLDALRQSCQQARTFRSTATFRLRTESENAPAVSVSVSRLDTKPNPLGLVTVREISQQKKAEQLLRASEAKHRSLVEYAPVCIHEIDLDGRLSSINPAGLKMLCLKDASEVIGLEYLSFAQDRDRARIAALLRQALDGQPAEFEFTAFVNDIPRLFSSSFVPIFGDDGSVTALTGTTQDITDSHEVMNRLRIQDLAINSAQVGITIVDASREDKPIIQCNPAFEKMTGFSRDEVIGKNCRFLQAGDLDQEGVQVLRAAIAEGRECTVVIRDYCKDGRMFWNEVSIAPIFDESEHVSHFVGFQNDVSERVEMQRMLRESESRFRTVFEQAAVGVGLVNTHTGQFVKINQKYADLIGYSPSEMTEKTFRDITFPDDLEEDLVNMDRLHAGEINEFTMEKRLIRKDGSLVWVKLTVSPTWQPDSKPQFHIAIAEDISDRKQFETQLRITQTAIDQNRGTIIRLNRQGRFTYVNESACQQLGFTHDELLSMHIWDIDSNRSMETWPGDWLRLKTDGSSTFESTHRKKDGTRIPTEITASYFNLGGEEYMFAFALDVSERKRAEENLRERENQLAHVARLSTMGEMVAGIAHEVNQPLYSIINFSKAVGNTIKDSQDDRIQEVAHWNTQIGTAAQHAGQIIKRLRGFVSQQTGKRAAVDVNEMITDAIDLVRFELNRGGISLQTALLKDSVDVNVDRVQVQQVMVNLLINAIEAMDRDTSADRRVLVDATCNDNQVEVSVADTGSGLPPQLEESLFDAFVSTKSGGMGMGLAISHTLIDSFDGRLWASNNQFGGATFCFSLPVTFR